MYHTAAQVWKNSDCHDGRGIFGKIKEEDRLFDALQIATAALYTKHLHQHEVFFIDLSRVPEKCSTYQAYITRIIDGIKKIYPTDFRIWT